MDKLDKHGLSSKERLEHIQKASQNILDFCSGIEEYEFLNNEKLKGAVLYNFLIIGEAIQYVDNGILERYPYPWHLPRSFRNYIAHGYFGINLRQVYKTVKEFLPELKELIETILKSEF